MSQAVRSKGGVELPPSRYREILEIAARIICKKGYEGASMQQIAHACGLTKAGLYYHIRSKQHLLVEIMHYGMDIFEERVLSQVEPITNPLERLRTAMAKNVLMVTRDRTKEITIILHEHATLTGDALARTNTRKNRDVRFPQPPVSDATPTAHLRRSDPRAGAADGAGGNQQAAREGRGDPGGGLGAGVAIGSALPLAEGWLTMGRDG